MRKISDSKPTLVGAPGSFRFFEQKTWFLVKNKSLLKITHQYFSVQNWYIRTTTTFLLKSNIQDIHIHFVCFLIIQ